MQLSCLSLWSYKQGVPRTPWTSVIDFVIRDPGAAASDPQVFFLHFRFFGSICARRGQALGLHYHYQCGKQRTARTPRTDTYYY